VNVVIVCSYKFRVDALLVEAEFDNVMDGVQSGIDAINFTAKRALLTFIPPANGCEGL